MKTCKSYGRDGKGNGARTAGQEANFEGLLRRHSSEAHNFALSLAGNAEEAKELVQEASCRAWKHSQSYEPLRSFKGWYLTIVRNAFFDARRSMKRALSLDAANQDGQEGALIDSLPDENLGVPEMLERAEIATAVHSAIGALGAKYRQVVRLCDLQGMGYEEAARRLGVPVGTVRSRLCRARAALRRDETIRRLA